MSKLKQSGVVIMFKPKIIFLVKSAKTPSSRIRIAELLPYFKEKGIETEIEVMPDSYRERHLLFNKCGKYDLVLLQKRLLGWFEFCELRKKSASLAFDFDDAVYLKNKSPSPDFNSYRSNTRHRRFKRIVKASDLVIAANPVLADFATQYVPAARIHVVPSGINMSRVIIHDTSKINEIPVIGWVGTAVTQCYLNDLAPELVKLKSRKNFILRVISNVDFQFDGLTVENLRWDKDTEYKQIQDFDVGIMPLTQDPFSKGKASYKLLQYLAAGVPSVASSVGMNVIVADGNENALLADNYQEFVKNIELILSDPELQNKLSENGRKLIDKEYSTEIVGNKFASIIDEFFRRTLSY